MVDNFRGQECNQHLVSACYGSGVSTGDMEIHMVWVKDSEVCDLR